MRNLVCEFCVKLQRKYIESKLKLCNFLTKFTCNMIHFIRPMCILMAEDQSNRPIPYTIKFKGGSNRQGGTAQNHHGRALISPSL